MTLRRIWANVLCLLMIAAIGPAMVGCHATNAAPQSQLYPTDVRTVAVVIFGNAGFERGIEFALTEALIKEIELRTPYKVVDRAAADSVITGRVLGAPQSLLSRERESAVPQELQVAVTADFEWKNQRTGDVIRQRAQITGTGEYVPTRPVGEFRQIAQQQAINELARDIVSLMRNDW
jgi:hypothetical protein